jgi:hypothetical protein
MTAGLIAILVIATPLILLPVVFVWYLNIAGVVGLIRERQKERTPAKGGVKRAAAHGRA